MKFILQRSEKDMKKVIEVEFSLDEKTKQANFYSGMSNVASLDKASLEAAAMDLMEIHGFELQNDGNYKHRIWFLRPILNR